MDSHIASNLLNPNIDKLINPFIPSSSVSKLPPPIDRFFGYRKNEYKEPPALVSWALSVLATVAGLCLVGGIYNYAPGIKQWHPPVLFASLGASAVLDYNAIRSPLAQPRNSVLGHTLAAIVGVGISRLFQLNTSFHQIEWVAGAVACAAATLIMSATNTVHPPGGATAVLAATNKEVIAMGWMYPPLILLATLLMLTVACLFNNTFRQYPTHWWSPEEVGQKLPSPKRRYPAAKGSQNASDDGSLEKCQTSNSDDTLHQGSQEDKNVEHMEGSSEVVILRHMIFVPAHVQLSDEESSVIEGLQKKLRLAGGQ